MARLIEIQDIQGLSQLTVRRGDVLLFCAVGAKVKSGTSIELTGVFVTAVVGNNKEVLVPAGPPNRVLFVARESGCSIVNIFLGDPFHSPRMVEISIDVES